MSIAHGYGTVADLQQQVRDLQRRLAVLDAMANEYNAWILAHAGGSDYDDFLRAYLKRPADKPPTRKNTRHVTSKTMWSKPKSEEAE